MAVIGIELGTTNSEGAHYDGQNPPLILPSSRPDGLEPSVVVYRKPKREQDDPILVGEMAASFAYRDPPNAIFSIKRLMGRAYDDEKVAAVRERVSYAIVPSEDPEDSERALLQPAKVRITRLARINESSCVLEDGDSVEPGDAIAS
jgi:molecular chaperone DnaK